MQSNPTNPTNNPPRLCPPDTTEAHSLVDGRSLPASELVVRQAHVNWLTSLQTNGNQPSPEHQDAGWQLLRAMVDQLYGLRTGRYAYALPCGAGKTQAVIALLAALASLRVFNRGITVLVVAQRVVALCEIKQKLISAGLSEQQVGLLHSKSGAAFPSTGSEKRPIMLVTHWRMQQGSLPECASTWDGKLQDLVIWDEALISTESVTLALDTTLSALCHFAESGKCPTVAQAYERLNAAMEKEKATQQNGLVATALSSLLTEQEAEIARREMWVVGHLDTTGKCLREQALSAISLIQNPISLVDPRNGNSAALMRYVVKVPDSLENIVILDASYAIDELRQADSTIRVGTTEAMIKFKDYSAVVAIHYPVASGRSAIKVDGRARAEAVRIAKGLSPDERVLFVTFKDWHERQLRAELLAAGMLLDQKMPNGEHWINVITWGRHTSDNSYTDCKHVVLVGLHRLPRVELASKLAAQMRDLTHRRDKTGLLDLEQSVIAGDVMQAMNRGCMRLTDASGKAHAMTTHIIAKDDLRQELEQAMPRLQWESSVTELDVGSKQQTRTQKATCLIVEYLDSLPCEVSKVSLKAIYLITGIKLGKDAKAEAMGAALLQLSVRGLIKKGVPWTREGLSLIRK